MFQLPHTRSKNRRGFFRINQQDQIKAPAQTRFQVSVRLPPQTPRAVSFYGVSKAPGEGKANPVTGQLVLQHIEFCPPASYTPALVKNLPDFFPSF